MQNGGQTFETFFESFDLLVAGLIVFLRRGNGGRSFLPLRNVLAILTGRSAKFWETSYRVGYWNFLLGREQRPRHYAVAGLLSESIPEGGSVLEVGCGQAPLLNLLKCSHFSYVGLDLSRAAIEECRKIHKARNAEFICENFETVTGLGPFDVLVASEVLYYFPIRKIGSVIQKLIGLLKPDGFLIITMNKNPKSWMIWFLLSFIHKSDEVIITKNGRGSCWRIAVYRNPISSCRVPDLAISDATNKLGT